MLGRQRIDGALAHDQERAPVGDVIAFGPRVGALDRRPGFDEADGRGRGAIAHVDEELLALGRYDAALVDDDELLEGAVEVVPEGPVRLRGPQVLPVRLDEDAVADLEVRDLLTDLDDAGDRLVPGGRRLGSGAIAGDFSEGLEIDARDHLRLARVRIELVEELRIGEADAAGLDLEHHLMRADRIDRLVIVDHELVLADDLDCVLRFGIGGHVASFAWRWGRYRLWGARRPVAERRSSVS